MLRFLALIPLLLLTACAEQNQPGSEEQTGEPRLLSLAPNVTEMLYALDLDVQIVGVTDYCLYPPEATEKPRVGGLHDVTVERSIVLNPTHVLHMGTPSDAVRRLEGRGIDVVSVQSETTGEVVESIRMLGEKFDREQRASVIADEIATSLDRIAAEYAEREPRPALYVVGHAPGALREVYVAGPNTFLDEFLQIANAPNIMGESAAPYPLLSREWAMRHRPEVILTSKGDGGTWTAREEAQIRELWREYLTLEADESLHIVFLDDPHLTIPGPSIASSALRIAQLIHEDAPQ